MLKIIASALGVLLIGGSCARANFLVQFDGAENTGPENSNLAPLDNPAGSQSAEASTMIHWKMAYGFGNDIPLSFACRQIVPPGVKVTYGPGVDRAKPVTWKGGDTWNHVLRAMLKPAGFNLQMSFMAVEIEK